MAEIELTRPCSCVSRITLDKHRSRTDDEGTKWYPVKCLECGHEGWVCSVSSAEAAKFEGLVFESRNEETVFHPVTPNEEPN
jgi:hypothetical protein